MKALRHSKICGDFGEALILYWLSKNGNECVPVDHIGIDIIDRNRITKELMGISVKSRTRIEGQEFDTVDILSSDLENTEKACKDFNCVPYFAIVVDSEDPGIIRVFIISREKLLELYPTDKNAYWKMNPAAFDRYKSEKIISFELKVTTNFWWPSTELPANSALSNSA